MALYLLRLNWTWNDAVVAGGDRIVWGWHVEASTQPTAAAFAANFEQTFGTGQVGELAQLIPTALEIESYQVYDVVNGGPPVDEALPVDPSLAAGGATGPTEVQLVVSRRVADGLGRPFKKGRQYIGPFAADRLDSPRPETAIMTNVGAFAVGMHSAFEQSGWTPVVDTKGALHVPEEIVDYVIDNAWDTQRRRGLEPTSETVYTPS